VRIAVKGFAGRSSATMSRSHVCVDHSAISIVSAAAPDRAHTTVLQDPFA